MTSSFSTVAESQTWTGWAMTAGVSSLSSLSSITSKFKGRQTAAGSNTSSAEGTAADKTSKSIGDYIMNIANQIVQQFFVKLIKTRDILRSQLNKLPICGQNLSCLCMLVNKLINFVQKDGRNIISASKLKENSRHD